MSAIDVVRNKSEQPDVGGIIGDQQNIIQSSSEQQNVGIKSTEKLTSKTNQLDDTKIIRKCIRKGSRICYTDMENITVLKKIPEKETSRLSFMGQAEKMYEKVDSYRSGESLFKTFTFEQTRDTDDPETLKCIEFWKSVMRKNLAPIKCTLLECDKKSVEKSRRGSSDSSNRKAEIKESQEKTKKTDMESDVARIWSEALKEIRKKKLDRLKLYVSERCEFCRDPFTNELRAEMGVESKEEQLANIVSLNDWKPNAEQIDLMQDLSKPSLKKRFSGKIKKISATQTTETRINEEPQKESSKTKNLVLDVEPQQYPSTVKTASSTRPSSATTQEPTKRLPSAMKHSSNLSEHMGVASDGPRRVSTLRVASTEVQAPVVKCSCDVDSCTCPHKAAAKNSKTSFIEIARKTQLQEDRSIEKFFPTDEEGTCVCSKALAEPYPWLNVICSTEPCLGKSPKVEVEKSSSDFNLQRILESDKQSTCICSKLKAICTSEECENKESQGSLIEGFPEKEDKEKEDICPCAEETEVPCVNEICPTKVPEIKSIKCVCGKNLPWSQAECHSWSCPHNYHKLRKRKPIDEEKITFRGHPPIKEDASSCFCATPQPWKHVTCTCEQCESKPRIEPILRSVEKKATSRASKEVLIKREKSSREKLTSSSKEKLGSKEKSKQKTQPENDCICSTAPPWRTITCPSDACKTKEEMIEKAKRKNLSPEKSIQSQFISKDTDCICKDKTLEPICNAYKCKDREVSVEYPPPCLCPKDQDELKHEHFKCMSETCKIKKINRTCICMNQPGTPCDTKTCETKPKASKTLKYVHKPLKYDSKCICKVRGLPTTQEVSCTAPECPFKKKYWKLPKKKTPKLFMPTPYENIPLPDEPTNKCICGTKDLSVAITCPSLTCRKKSRSTKSDQSGQSFGDDTEDYLEPEICVCNNLDNPDSEHEVICRQVQCQKISVGEGGVVMNDKCVCANVDAFCSESACPTTVIDNEKVCREDSMKKERPYCYICGHYDCRSKKIRSELTERVCREQHSSTTEEQMKIN